MIVVNARFLTQNLTGVQRFAIEISLELKCLLGDSVEFITPHNVMLEDYAKELNVKKIGKHTGHRWEQFDLPKYLRANGNPLLVCLCNTAPIMYKNKISTIHDVAFKVYPQTFSKSFLWFYRFIIPNIIRTSKHIVTVSEFSKSEIIKYYGTDPNMISVVYNAVSSNFTHREDLDLKSKRYILAVSSLNYRKNFIAVLKAFSLFQHKNTDLSLYIVGDLKNGNFADIDISQYENNPRIKFLGRISDEELIRYYSNAEFFVYPSIYEGFGIPPLEAQSCGCPVLSADIPPLREVLQNSAMYCDPYSIDDIAEKMGLIVRNTDELQAKGYSNICRFSWRENAEKLVCIIKTPL